MVGRRGKLNQGTHRIAWIGIINTVGIIRLCPRVPPDEEIGKAQRDLFEKHCELRWNKCQPKQRRDCKSKIDVCAVLCQPGDECPASRDTHHSDLLSQSMGNIDDLISKDCQILYG